MKGISGIDLYELELFRLVARFRSFTAAAESAGISQSALSRQVQSIEGKLGVRILERTTRSVTITEAGAILLRETEAIPNIMSGALRRIREECRDAPREITVGISSELALAHVPGIFQSRLREADGAKTVVFQDDDFSLFGKVTANGLDLAIVCAGGKQLDQVEVMQTMEDRFIVISSAGEGGPENDSSRGDLKKWAAEQSWIFPSETSTTRGSVEKWIKKLGWEVRPGMELASYDLMIHFVSLGMGSAFVPRRALSGFPRKHLIAKVEVPLKLSRTLLAVTPRFSHTPDHVRKFLDGILFS